MNRIEIPRGEFTYSNAVQQVINVNKIYDPRWIFCDAGAAEMQIEQLHLYGERHPNSGLKNKVERYQFSQTIDIPDPVRRTIRKEPLKPFMVNSLVKCFEDGRMILSPFDDVIYKQLIDYVIERVTPKGLPVYTSENEHFVDALGLAYLAMVLKFPTITQYIQQIKHATGIIAEAKTLAFSQGEREIRSIESARNVWRDSKLSNPTQIGKQPGEREGDYQKWVRGPSIIPGRSVSRDMNSSSREYSRSFSRGGFGGRSFW